MVRRRSKSNLDLPVNLYRGSGSAWRYRHPVTGKFHGMGTDKQKAIYAARKLNDMLMPADDLVGSVLGRKTFTEFKTLYLNNKVNKDGSPLADKTMELYVMRLNQCEKVWGGLPIEKITLLMVNEHLDSLTTRASNQCRSILVDLFNLAISKGICPDNPAAMTLRKNEKKTRKRHTVDGLQKIRDVSPFWLQNAIDLALLTAQRRIDILNMKWSDIQDGYLHIAQQKTTKQSDDEFEELHGAGYVRIKIDSELQAVLNRCRSDNLISPFIIHRVPKTKQKAHMEAKEHWTQVNLAYLTAQFKAAVKKSKAYPGYTDDQLPTFHEIRALSIFLHKKAGKDAQKIAGHATQAMTTKYASGHEIMWNDVNVGIKLPFSES